MTEEEQLQESKTIYMFLLWGHNYSITQCENTKLLLCSTLAALLLLQNSSSSKSNSTWEDEIQNEVITTNPSFSQVLRAKQGSHPRHTMHKIYMVPALMELIWYLLEHIPQKQCRITTKSEG